MKLNQLPIAFTLLALLCCDGNDAGSLEKSDSKMFTSFSIVTPACSGTIDETAKTIMVVAPYGTDRTALVAEFSSTGVLTTINSTEQTSGITSNNFTNPVIYTITAADGSQVNYTVTIEVEPLALYSFGPLQSYIFKGHTGCTDPPLTVTLNGTPSFDTFISISSEDPTLSVADGGVLIPAGSSSAAIVVTGYEISENVRLTATLGTSSLQADVCILPPE